jgi:hypothetical protein
VRCVWFHNVARAAFGGRGGLRWRLRAMKKIVSVLRLDFAMEWGLLGLVALIDALWAEAINFHLILTWRDCNILWVGLGLMLALRFFLPGRAALKGGLIAEYFCLTMMATCVFTVMS